MGPVALTAFALVTGLTVSGLSGSIMELVARRQIGFSEPFVSPRHIARSLASTAFAGPFMLTNDALHAWRSGAISGIALGSCGCTAIVWSGALGVLVIELARLASGLPG